MNGDLGFLAGNFLQAFAQGTEKKKQDDENKRYKKLLSDALEFQIDQMHKQQGAQNDLSSMMAQPVSQPAAPVPQYQSPPDGVLGMLSQVGSTPASPSLNTDRPRNFLDILADPPGRMAAIMSGKMPELHQQDQMLAQSELAKGIGAAGGDPSAFLQSPQGAALAVRAGMSPTTFMTAAGKDNAQTIELARLSETMRHNHATENNQQVEPSSVENTAQMIANGQMQMLSGFALKTPWGQQVISRVKELNSDFNAGQFPARAGTLKAFSSGIESRTVRSLNVAIAHLGVLSNLAGALDNTDAQALNAAKNAFQTQFGNAAPTNFTSARDIVANEVVKAVTASGGTLADREEAQRQIKASASPAQLSGVIATWKQLLGGQLGGLQQQYEQGTGQKDFQRFLAPETIRELEGGQQAAGPVRVNTPDEAMRLPPGTQFMTPDGRIKVRP